MMELPMVMNLEQEYQKMKKMVLAEPRHLVSVKQKLLQIMEMMRMTLWQQMRLMEDWQLIQKVVFFQLSFCQYHLGNDSALCVY